MKSERWIEAVDEKSGQIYYYHSVTRETAWKLPSKDEAYKQEKESPVQQRVEDDKKSLPVPEEKRSVVGQGLSKSYDRTSALRGMF